MATQHQLESHLAEVEEKLRLGIESVSTDGTSTRVNLKELRQERENLRRQLARFNMQRPVASRIELGGF